MAFLIIGFTIFNFIIYHKIFRVIYFDLKSALFKEFATCFFFAGIETALIMVIGPYILVGIIIIAIILGIVAFVKKLRSSSEEKEQETSNTQKNMDNHEKKSKAKKNNAPSADTIETPKYVQGNDEKQKRMTKEADAVEDACEIQNKAKANSDKMFCPYCGEKILRTAKFCNFCGKSNSYKK